MTRRRRLVLRSLPVFLLMLPPVLTACSNEDEASEALAALEAEFEAEQEALSEEQDSLPEMSERPDSAERAAYRAMLDSISARYEELTNSFIPRHEALAEEYWGTVAGLEAKIWVMSRSRTLGEEDEDEEAKAARLAEQTEAIFEEYGESPHMELLAENSFLFTDEQADEYLGRLRENSPHANVRAAAIYYPAARKLARLRIEEQFGRLELAGGPEEGPGPKEDAESTEAGDPEETTEPEEITDPRAEIEADLQLLIDEYGEIPMGGSTYGALAYAYLTAHTEEELAIGQPAPEIVGHNVDGEEIRLSQFLGKVVVLDFWGDW